VCSKKTIAPICRGSRSRGGRGRETRSRSLFFWRGRRSSVNDRQGDTTKEHRQADLFASSIARTSRSPTREVGDNTRICAGHGGRTRGRIEGVTADQAVKATATMNLTGETRSGHRDGGSSQEGRSSGESSREGRDSDGSNEGDEGVGGGVGPAG
jgi:hypothetical protein